MEVVLPACWTMKPRKHLSIILVEPNALKGHLQGTAKRPNLDHRCRVLAKTLMEEA